MALPEPQWPLLARKDYKVTSLRVVSICVVETRVGRQIRLYRWRRNREDDPWNVGLANIPLHEIDLDGLVRDVKQLASQYHVQLSWVRPAQLLDKIFGPRKEEDSSEPPDAITDDDTPF